LEEEVLWLTEKNKDKDNQIATVCFYDFVKLG